MIDDTESTDSSASPPPVSKRSNLPKIIGFGCLGLVVVSVVLLIVFARDIGTSLGNTAKDYAREELPRVVKSKEFADMAKYLDTMHSTMSELNGLDITRSRIMLEFQDMAWGKASGSGWQENYVGTSNALGMIQLSGPDKELYEASYTLTFRKDGSPSDDSIAIAGALRFANVIDSTAVPEIRSRLLISGPLSYVDKQFVIGQRQFQFERIRQRASSDVTITIRVQPKR